MLQPQMKLHSRPCTIYQYASPNCDTNKTDLRTCVLESARYAETLTVAASLKNANQILLDDSILAALQTNIRRLTVLSCTDGRSFQVMSRVAEKLLRGGVVRELCVGHCTLSSDMLKEMLEYGTTDSDCFTANNDLETVDSWTEDKCESLSESSDVIDGLGNLSDLYDVALQPCGAEFLPADSVVCRSCSARTRSSRGIGVQALTLINVKSTSGNVDSVLCDILLRLCRLERLALVGLTDVNNKKTVNLSRTSHYLCTLIQSGQLSHVIIDGCHLPDNFLSMLVSALLRRCRCVLSRLIVVHIL